LRASAALDSVTASDVAAIATSPIGMLRKKIHRQPRLEATSAPPAIGPTASASPVTPAQTPIARARVLESGNVVLRIAIALSIDPPTA
jgi:hypothetical protein